MKLLQSATTGRRLRFGRVVVLGISALLIAACGGGESGGNNGGEGGGSLNRPITLVVPFGPGGGADSVARTAAAAMEDELGVGVPVINVEGGTGSTGMTRMLSGRPDESMAALIQDTLATIPAGSAAFELEEIQGVCRLQEMPSALFVGKKTGYKDWKDLEAAASSDPGSLKAATVGAGGVDDVVLAALADSKGTEFRAVPYADPSQRYAAVLGGSADVMYEQLGDVRQYIESGDFIPVMIFSEKPVAGYEDVPLSTDLDVPADVILPQFRGLVISAEASKEIVSTLSDACGKAVETPEFKKFQEQVYAVEDSYMPADAFNDHIKEQESVIADLLEQYNISTS